MSLARLPLLLSGLTLAGSLLAAPALASPALASPNPAACPKPVEPGELARLLSTADAAFADLDADTFSDAVVQARAAIPCLSAALSAGQVAAYHRAEAYQAFLDRDHAAAVQHFRAMLAASPGYRLSELVAPEGHPLRVDFDIALGLPVEPTRTLPTPTMGLLRVDGRETDQAPTALPFVLQQVDAEGKVLASTLVEQGSTRLAYQAVPEDEDRKAGRASGGSRRRLGAPLIAAALVAGGTSAGLYAMSNARAGEFWDPATPDEELEQLRKQTNAMATASLGVGVVAIGAGTAAVLSFAW